MFYNISLLLSDSYLPAQCIDSTDIVDSLYYFQFCIPHPAGVGELDINPVCGCDSMSYVNIQ
ncbi:MAG: hypothetical protein IPH93_16420, partial [Saprospiraceae bacterium]|nr:hypothetical protein [Saprospiraceae bacterium]